MKYWRGILVAAIVAACTWGLRTFSQAHTKLVDMIYPYVTRMMQGNMAQWSSGVDFSVWQVAMYCGIIVVLALVVVMVVRHWNPIRLIGWVLAFVSVISLFNTVLYGLNEFSGPLAEDLRMEVVEYAYSPEELEAAAIYYRDEANKLANQVEREGAEQVSVEFEELAAQAGNGFAHLVYDKGYSVFAGSTLPVKKMVGAGKGTPGKTVPLTGEATVNARLPMTALPFAMCHEMSHRMCIAIDRDADFGAFLACISNESVAYQYAGYVTAYMACLEAIEQTCTSDVVNRVVAGENENLKNDLKERDRFFGNRQVVDPQMCDLLVCWHIETQVLPTIEEEEVRFDPTDETQVDLSGIANAR